MSHVGWKDGDALKKVALVTGCGGGIGGAVCALLAERGWSVVGVDVRKGETPAAVRFIEADLGDPEVPRRVCLDVASHEKELHALVNNAAVQMCSPIVETSAAEIDRVMAVNVRAPMLLMRHALSMLERSGGAVVNVSSVHAVATSRDIAAYAASKGALVALTRAAALEFGERGVRVNAVLPGATDTPMLRAGLSRSHAGAGGMDERLTTLSRRHAVGRVGRAEEIARAIAFLADGGESGFVTGESLVVDGGALARLSTE